MKTEHILICRFSALGDVAMLPPVVYSLARQYPELRITVLSKPFAKPFFDNLAPNVNFMGADVKADYRGIRGLNRLYRRLSAKQFTAVADMHNVLRTQYLRLLFRLNGYRVAHINKHRKGKHLLTRQNGKQLTQQPTSFDNYAEVLGKLGYPVELNFQSIFYPSKGDLSALPDIFQHRQEAEPWIGVAPFAAHQGKIYPLEQLTAALKMIAERQPNARFFFFCGGKREKELVSKVCQELPRAINASELLGGMKQELALMSHLNCMISMDSGNMHLASLAGCKVVSIWGATHPYAGFMGWNQSAENAVQLEIPCRPCSIYGNRPCQFGDYRCLTGITLESIRDKVLKLIS